MKVRYNKGMGCPVEISDGKTATCISLDTAKRLQASLLAVIEQVENDSEPELTEFEHAFGLALVDAPKPEEKDEWYTFLKEKAAELLSLAREQFIKNGYVLEKKTFHDAVENISDKHLAEISVQYSIHSKVEDGTRHAVMNWNTFQKVAQKFIDIGKAG